MSYWTQKEKIQSQDFEFMMEEYEGTEFSAWDFLHGYCACFAFAYIMRYGGKIIKIKNDEFSNIHCYVETKKGGEIYYVDIRGKVKTEEELLEEFDLSFSWPGHCEFYQDIWEDYEVDSFHTFNQLRYFYNHYVKGYEKALSEAKKFIKNHREFYI